VSLLTNTFGGFEEDFVDIDFVTAVALAPINDDDDEEDVVHEEEEEEEEEETEEEHEAATRCADRRKYIC
tara:strand:- start:13 stop:222 length:210 start_codon:yes stop_codon:yes gene_type:complete